MERVFKTSNNNPDLVKLFSLELIDLNKSNQLKNGISLNLNIMELDNNGINIILRGFHQ